jgi:hypothetical protein
LSIQLITLAVGVLISSTLSAAESRRNVSAQYAAFAPNAGGQTAYSLRYATGDQEFGVFSNQYLMAGDYPLTGATYEKVMPLCKKDCFWELNLQAGAGISNGGPLIHLTWSSVVPLLPLWLPRRAPRFVPALRLDLTTQMILIQTRAITWSYPLWAGISYPF